MSQTPPAVPTQPTSLGVASGYGIFVKAGAGGYNTGVHNPPGTINPDYVTYFANLRITNNTTVARQVMQDGAEYAQKVLTEMDFSVDIFGEENDTKIAELLAAVQASGDAGLASAAIVSPLGASWAGWFTVGNGAPGTDSRGLKMYSFDFTHIGQVTFTAAP